jgi:hypothetical protein
MPRSIVATVSSEGRDAAVQRAVEELAEEMHADPNTIGTYGVDWATYVNRGVAIELTIGGWTAETQVQPEDVGLTPTTEDERDAWRKLLRLGSRFLLPEDEISKPTKIRVAARHALYDRAVKVLGAWFVNVRKYDDWVTETEELERRYRATWQDILDRWEEIQARVRTQYEAMGRGAYQRLRQNGVTTAFGLPLSNERDYIERYVERALRKVPTKRYVEQLIRFEWKVRYLPLAELLTQERADELERAHQEALSRMERDVLAQRQDREAINRELQQFSRDLQGALYQTVYETTLASIEILQGKSGKALKSGETRIPIQRLRTMIQLVNDSLIWPDERLAEHIRRLEKMVPDTAVDATPEDRERIEQALARLNIESRVVLTNIEWQTELRSGHHVGLPEDVEEIKQVTRTRPRAVSPEVPSQNIEGMGTVRRRRSAAVA